MNKKGEIGMVSILLATFVAIIVGLALLQGAAVYTGLATNTRTLSYTNGLYTAPASGSCIDLRGQELLSAATVINRTDATAITSNYTIAEGVSTVDGLKRIRFCTTGAYYSGGAMDGKLINVSYSYGDEGYVNDAGARSVVLMILIFGGLAIAVVALTPTLRSGVIDMVS
jgi:hypothetical protein